MRLLFPPGAILALILRSFLVIWGSSSLAVLEGFTSESISSGNNKPATLYFLNDRIISVLEPKGMKIPELDQSRTKRRTTSRLNMVESSNDPAFLLTMVEELEMEEITPEIVARMENVEIALVKFLEAKGAALLEEGKEEESIFKPFPPSIAPPDELLGDEGNVEFQSWGEHGYNSAQGANTSERLQRRLLEEALERIRARLNEEYFIVEHQQAFQQYSEEEEILRQAQEALQKSREAAMLRKAQAERRSVSAAKVSAVYRQQEQQRKKEQYMEQEQQNRYEDLSFESKESNEPENPNKNSLGFDVPRKRPTIQVGSLSGKGSEGRDDKAMDGSDDKSDEDFWEERRSRAPDGIPILYNWIQDEVGCITGNVKKSIYFSDGATISTSSVTNRAREGTLVTTESGSQYFLEEQAVRESVGDYQHNRDDASRLKPATSQNDNTMTAPKGIPTVKCWQFDNGGGIVGLIYGSPDAEDGDYIETSPIVNGEIDNNSVVYTQSGSRYFLSGDPPENAFDTLLTFRDEVETERSKQGGTFTLTKLGGVEDGEGRGPRRSRSTFSLFDLFGGKRNSESPNSLDSVPLPLPPPSPDKMPPIGTPTLTGCVFNDNGTITGYIFGSPKIDDGYLITTSVVVEGERRQFETVTTETGSLYFLG